MLPASRGCAALGSNCGAPRRSNSNSRRNNYKKGPHGPRSFFGAPGEMGLRPVLASLVGANSRLLVVLNRVARSIVESARGEHGTYVFTYCGRRLKRMNNSAWRRARRKVGLVQVRIHDLKHTFGRRLRAAGVSFEDRQDLLGHKSGRITSHYSAAELGNLIEAANKVAGQGSRKSPALVVLKKKAASA